NDPLYEVHLIDTLYSIQNNIENSKIKDLVKISIINARQIPMSLLNMTLEKIDPLKLDSEINRLLTGDDIDKMNLILLLEKYTNTSGIIIYKLDELKESYQNNIISDLINLNNDQKEIKLKQYVDKLSYENLGFIKDILKILEEDATSNANPEFAIVSGRILDLVAKKGIITNKICSNYYEPVCGADNVTYDNECFIEKVGIDIKYRAECRIEENTKLKPITEEDLQRGWYYGTKETKKPSTPLNWILIDENTKYSKWIDTQKTIILKKPN
ncbi:MAG TPA: Kazal-type serine protease inhibitor family protein, partial [bacterium]|nr:Kazal-type serine protease inhibitor family protein [bacterium]